MILQLLVLTREDLDSQLWQDNVSIAQLMNYQPLKLFWVITTEVKMGHRPHVTADAESL